MNSALTSKNIEPACEYCKKGRLTPAGDAVFCRLRGFSPPGERCKSFKYDPLKRKPRRRPALQKFDAGDFTI